MKKLLFLLVFIGCNKKNEDLNLVLKNKELTQNSICEFEITNLSNSDYFLPLSNSDFENNSIEKSLYNSIFIQPIFSDETGNVINPKVNNAIVKHSKESGDKYFTCVELELKKFNSHIKNIQYLKENIKISAQKNVTFKQNILNFNQTYCNLFINSRYDFKKGKRYFIHFEYQLDKEYFYSKVDKKALIKIEKLGYKPYFGKLISNKVPFIGN